MTIDVAFIVPMHPSPQGRPRAFSFGTHTRVHKPPADVRHEQQFAAMARPFRPVDRIDEAIGVDVLFVLPRPKSLSKLSKRDGEPLQDPTRRWATGAPDVDNLAKTVLDAMKGWWRDDALVCGLRAAKVVTAFDELPGYHVRVRSIADWMRNDNGAKE
jgi:Holliday junction resolvase RusA-like endonuclease